MSCHVLTETPTATIQYHVVPHAWCFFRSQVYVWSAEFDLELGGMESTLLWEVEYGSEAAVRKSRERFFFFLHLSFVVAAFLQY